MKTTLRTSQRTLLISILLAFLAATSESSWAADTPTGDQIGRPPAVSQPRATRRTTKPTVKKAIPQPRKTQPRAAPRPKKTTKQKAQAQPAAPSIAENGDVAPAPPKPNKTQPTIPLPAGTQPSTTPPPIKGAPQTTTILDPDGVRLIRQPAKTLDGHVDIVWSVAWSPDGRYIASGSEDKTVRVWTATTGQLIRSLTAPIGRIQSVVWSPDSSQIAGAGGDGKTQIWDLATGRTSLTLNAQGSPARSLTWSPTSGVAGGNDSGNVTIWDSKTGESKQIPTEGKAVAWSPNDRKLAIGTQSGVQIWGAATGQMELSVESSQPVDSLAWSPDSSRLAIAGQRPDGPIEIWDLTSRRRVLYLAEKGLPGYHSVTWSQDGSRIAAASAIDGSISVWKAATGEATHLIVGSTNSFSVAWSPDGTQLAAAGRDRIVRLWPISG